jgi:Holliday junction resolvasome RuvABC endonuclease subunit
MGSLLALDLGTKLEFALWINGEVRGGTQKLCHDRNASGVRFLHFRRWLMEMIRTHNVCAVFFERAYGHKGVDAAHVYGAFMCMLAAVCEEMKIECRGFDVGTIKKHATGKGNATKEEMMTAARSWGFDPVDDNEADGLAILHLALKTIYSSEDNLFAGRDGSFPAIRRCAGQPPAASLASEIF